MLAIPYCKQDTGYSCGAASVQMVLRYFGIVVSEHDLMEKLETDTDYGTHHRPIIDVFTSYGLYCYVNTDGSLEEVNFYLEQDLPVIVNYIEPSENAYHYTVMLDVRDTEVVLHDPWNGPHFTMLKNDFEERWHDEKGDFPRWFLVISKEDFHVGRQYRPQVETVA